MVHAHRLKDESPESEGQRPLDASSSSSFTGSRNLPEGDSIVFLELSVRGDLAKVTPFTTEAVARRQVAGTKVLEGTINWESFALKNKRVVVIESSFDLDFCTSKVT